MISLLPFFEFYRRDVPHRMAAIKQLEESMPAELLDESAEWIQAWKASGIDQEVWMPQYFRQLDLPNGQRMCFTSAAAMVGAHHRKIKTQEEYSRIREKFGDTTSVYAHVKALSSLGLQVRFVDNADAEDVMEAIDAGTPVLVGWYHRGDMLRGEPPMCGSEACGHWSLIHGYQSRYSNDAAGSCQTLLACQILRGARTIRRSLVIASVCAKLPSINVGKSMALGAAGPYLSRHNRLHPQSNEWRFCVIGRSRLDAEKAKWSSPSMRS